jgi:hypothetical protein
LSVFFLLFRKKERNGSGSWRTTSLGERTNDATLGKGNVVEFGLLCTTLVSALVVAFYFCGCAAKKLERRDR